MRLVYVTAAMAMLMLAPALASLQIAPWFPQEQNYVFDCSADGFEATSYDWFFGDGDKLIDIDESSVWHTYHAQGTFEVSCVASDAMGNVDVNLLRIVVPEQVPDTPDHTYATITIVEYYPLVNRYVFDCETTGFEATSYDWDFADGHKLYDMTVSDVWHDFEEGEYDVSCVATDGELYAEDQIHLLVLAEEEEPMPVEEASLTIAPWFPQGKDYVFWCETTEFEPEEYLFEFGDGEKITLTTDNVWHTFQEAGEYEVTCTPMAGEQVAHASLWVDVE